MNPCLTVSEPCLILRGTRSQRRKVRPCLTVSRPCLKIAVSRAVPPLFSERKEGPDTVFGHGQNGQKMGHGPFGNAEKNAAGHGLDTVQAAVEHGTVSQLSGTRSNAVQATDRVRVNRDTVCVVAATARAVLTKAHSGGGAGTKPTGPRALPNLTERGGHT